MEPVMAAWMLAGALLAAGWASYRYPWWRKPVDYSHPRILTYHMITDPRQAGPIPSLAVKPETFERQIAYLRKAGWHFAKISELYSGSVPAKTVAITFDDGYQDNLTHALPILLRYQAKATLYLIADRQRPLAAGGRPDGQPLAPLLSNDEVRKMLDSGAVELGAHTLTHPNLVSCEPAVRRHELSEGKRRLEQDFARPINAFAYPFGGLDSDLPELVAEAGFDSAATTRQGISRDLAADRLRLQRIRISGRDNLLNFRLRLRIGRKR
jgi:peptidoglycan/xylan/chitin deacetylase (PgdA/CDA1 family)